MHRPAPLRPLLILLLAAAVAPAAAVEPAATTAAGPGATATPIDCPLHAGGASADHLRPFAETEKYIEFLDRPDRAAWQRPDAVVAALHLGGGETLVDVGAGSGYFSFRFARALPRGRVVAVDIDPEMIRHVHHRVMAEGISNLRVVLADPKDPSVDPAADLVFVCDVIHHVQGREAWLGRLFSEMKAGARLVVVEFKEGKLPQGPPEAVKIPAARLRAMLQASGFTLESEDPKLLPYQTFLVFRKPGASAPTTP